MNNGCKSFHIYEESPKMHPPPHLKRVPFSQVALAPSAVMAFRDLCIECTDILAPEIELLVEPFFSVYQNPTIKNREKVTDVINML